MLCEVAMKNNKKPLDLLNTEERLSKKTASLFELINTGVELYHDYYINPEFHEISRERKRIKGLLRNNLNVSEIKELTARLKKMEPKRIDLEWHYMNADALADSDVIGVLLSNTFPESKKSIEMMLRQYQQASFYVLHTASALVEVAEELLHLLESCADLLLKKISKKSRLSDQLIMLKKCIQEELISIAAAMALRIESAFYYRDITQDDAVVYVYHRLIETGSLVDSAPLRAPQRSLDVALFSKFYTYIQEHGSEEVKVRLNKVITIDSDIAEVNHFQVIKTELRGMDKKAYKIPGQLKSYIPIKKPTFWKGAKLRYDFFKKHSGTLVMLESYGRWEEQRHPYSNVSFLFSIREEIRRHRQELNLMQKSVKGIRGLFLGKTKRFLSEWQGILAKEEQRSWIKHYNALKKQVEDYLQYPDKAVNTRQALLEHVSVFMIEIEKFGPFFTKTFVPFLNQLKVELNHEASEDAQLIKILTDQIQTSEALLLEDDLVVQPSYDSVSLSSRLIEDMERQMAELDEVDEIEVCGSDQGSSDVSSSGISASKRKRIASWGSQLFLEPQGNRDDELDESLYSKNSLRSSY